MGYRIVYGEESVMSRRSSLRLWTAVFLLAFVVSVRLTWPQGTEYLKNVLKPADQTVQAFAQMVDGVENGQGMGEAVTAFCRSVVSSAQIG